jgi:antirestriction protein
MMARRKKTPTPPPPPSIYAASVADRDAGRLHGVWIDATQPIETMQEAIDEMLVGSSVPGATRWSIDDAENFAGIEIRSDDDLERVGELAAGVVKHGAAFAAWLEHFGADPAGPEPVEQFEAVYLGEHWSAAEPIDDRALWNEFRRIVWSCCSPALRIALRLDLGRLADFYVRKGDLVELPTEHGPSWLFRGDGVPQPGAFFADEDEDFSWLPRLLSPSERDPD